MPQQKLTPEIVNAAIDGFEAQKARIDAQIAELRAILTGVPAEPAVATQEPAKGKRKRFSAAARRRMKEAQQLRWAKIRGEAEPVAVPAAKAAPSKPKRKLSKAGRANIVAALKKRWAAKKSAA